MVQESSKSAVVGAAPEGASDPHSAARAVREMFTSIAPRYDLLNHVLSFNIDHVWWRRTARTFRHILDRRDAHILDLCCGTGDMTFALRRAAGKPSPQILGADFSHAMLQRATAKSATRNGARPGWIEADALNLPFPASRFDLVTSAFGFRNLGDYDAGLREIARVLDHSLAPIGRHDAERHVLGVGDATAEEVVLKLDKAFPNDAEPGAILEFEGTLESFTKAPFALTVLADREKIEGWPAARSRK